ncbi:unnamed protein product [Nippostrongylus brasiliensis]|uniref:Secreted protein n=1 Tax=Nippostrongylus brasiliensis TaxID=27835 RepID=A0A0N4XSH8_NIPBR|nr:unnamed protein product [Nippostrongylus brasiliensis]
MVLRTCGYTTVVLGRCSLAFRDPHRSQIPYDDFHLVTAFAFTKERRHPVRRPANERFTFIGVSAGYATDPFQRKH